MMRSAGRDRDDLPAPARPLAQVPFSLQRYDREVRALYRQMDGIAAITAPGKLNEAELHALRAFVAQANELLRYRESAAIDPAAQPRAAAHAELCAV